METFTHRYKLLKDTPTHKTGRTIGWSGNEGKFYFYAISEWKHDNGAEGIYLEMDGPSFSLEKAKDTEWFTPVGKEVPFIPQFPSKGKISEYVELDFDCRLVNDVDECRALNGLFETKQFKERLYDFVKKEYQEHYHLTQHVEK